MDLQAASRSTYPWQYTAERQKEDRDLKHQQKEHQQKEHQQLQKQKSTSSCRSCKATAQRSWSGRGLPEALPGSALDIIDIKRIALRKMLEVKNTAEDKGKGKRKAEE